MPIHSILRIRHHSIKRLPLQQHRQLKGCHRRLISRLCHKHRHSAERYGFHLGLGEPILEGAEPASQVLGTSRLHLDKSGEWQGRWMHELYCNLAQP